MSAVICKATNLPIPDTGREREVVHLRHTHEVERGEYPVELVTYTLDAGVFCSTGCLTIYLLGDLIDIGTFTPCRMAWEAAKAKVTSDEEPF